MAMRTGVKGRKTAIAGAVAFLFFLIKGLAWVLVPLVAIRGCT